MKRTSELRAFVMAAVLLAQAACDHAERNACVGRSERSSGRCGRNSAPEG